MGIVGFRVWVLRTPQNSIILISDIEPLKHGKCYPMAKNSYAREIRTKPAAKKRCLQKKKQNRNEKRVHLTKVTSHLISLNFSMSTQTTCSEYWGWLGAIDMHINIKKKHGNKSYAARHCLGLWRIYQISVRRFSFEIGNFS